MTRKTTVHCDKCGVQIDNLYPTKKAIFRVFKGFHFLLEKDSQADVNLELCSPCYQKILEFVQEK